MSDLQIVGRSLLKEDAYQKVRGTALYAADMGQNCLYARAVRSPHAHARVLGISTSAALAVTGVVAVFTCRDVPGKNRVGMTGNKDQLVLAEDRVRFLGEAVAVVVGTSEEACRAGVRLVQVEYEPLPVVTDPEKALEPGAPLLGEETNLCFNRSIITGNFEQALAAADVVVSGEYRAEPVEHAYIEPNAVYVEINGESLHLHTTSKSAHLEQKEVARFLGLPLERVRVTTANIGGSFGGKPDLPLDCLAALAAFKTGRAVKMVYDREEDLQVTAKRHGGVMRYTHAAKKDGTILGVMLDMIADAGAYIDYTPTVLTRSLLGAVGPYRVPNLQIRVRGVLTNNPVAGAMRGFGLPQTTFACERQMDRLAAALDMDPWELRLKNCLVDGDQNASGQIMQGAHIRETMLKARQIFEQQQHDAAEPLKPYERRAWGLANACYGNGRTAMPNPGVARTKLLKDGSIEAAVGSPDIGQGSNTVLKQIAAEALGVPPEYVRVITGDTELTPDSGTTSGTRVTTIVARAMQLAAADLRSKIMAAAAETLDWEASSLTLAVGPDGLAIKSPRGLEVTLRQLAAQKPLEADVKYDPPTSPLDENGQGIPYATYTYGTVYARVKVNTCTGKVDVEKLISVYDVGTVVNPPLLLGQVEGGLAMGLGYALTEELKLSKGRVANNNFDNYIILTSLDMPEISFHSLDIPDHIGPFGAKGVGEPVVLPVAAAVANAVSNALDTAVSNLPMNLEEVIRLAERA